MSSAKDFDQVLQAELAGYEGRHDHLLSQAPALYRLLVRLLDDPNLPGRLRPLVLVAIAYFFLPSDIIPEDLQGPFGYLDDIFLCAFVAERIRKETGTDELLTGNWDGEAPVLPLVSEILSQEAVLIGDKRDLILWFIGYEHLPSFNAHT